MANVDKLDATFKMRLQQLVAASGGRIKIGSAFRTNEEQARLYKAKPHLAAKPGHSNHERGLAADLIYAPGAQEWAHQNAAKFGLRFPMLTKAKGKKYEPWHVELASAPRSSYGGSVRAAERKAADAVAPTATATAPTVEGQERFTFEYQLQSLGNLLMGATNDG